MVLGAVTLTFSNLALQIIIGAIAAALTGRAMRGAGFGLLGDLLFGVLGALVANFAVSYFNLFDSGHYGLPGEIIVAVIGAVLLVMVTHLFSRRRTSSSAV
jgi:uncharacterized membrane protein YeaQ/YmgE (transglycosylase-associated protein family)